MKFIYLSPTLFQKGFNFLISPKYKWLFPDDMVANRTGTGMLLLFLQEQLVLRHSAPSLILYKMLTF
jgi:hypothetical protein